MFCPKCGTQNDESSRFCSKCGAPLTVSAPLNGPTPPPPPPPIPVDPRLRGGPTLPVGPTGKTFAAGKTPWVAVLLSFLLPGAGQFYNGDNKKGAIMLVAAMVLLVTVVGYLGIVIWSMIDSHSVASGKSPLW